MKMKQLDLFYSSDKEKLTYDIFESYYDARKNKRNTINAIAFEKHFENNLFHLVENIMDFNYSIKPSICFITDKPTKREIFAADFSDRVVHHLIYNYISPLYENIFINDSYSCRVGKGTHYGINRINEFISACSKNYSDDCYILKLDILGYFMSIDKNILYKKVKEFLLTNINKINFNLEIVLYLLKKIIFNDPRVNCLIKGKKSDWNDLPKSKSLFYAKENCGLPIGNLTSQLFGNVYLNDFDHFVKHDLGIRYYGRYVDDFVIVNQSKEYLKSLIPIFSNFLQSTLKLTLHPKKIYLQHYSKGLQFLGAVIKPHRIYIANRTKGNFYNAIQKHNKIAQDHKPSKEEQSAFLSSMNSYLGTMKHYKTYKLRKKFINKYLSGWWENYVYASCGYSKFVLVNKPYKAIKRKRKKSCILKN